MSISKPTLQRVAKRALHLGVACGLALGASALAQSSSSSSSSDNYRSHYYNNQSSNQYGQARKPRYTGHSWTDHLTLEGGGGVTAPGGGTQKYANTGFNILLGGGFRFNRRLDLLAEWQFNDMGVPRTLSYVVAGTPGGNEHLWTADLNPKYDFLEDSRADAYVIGGGGFSRALINYTAPVTVPCGYGYGYGYGYGFGGYGCAGNVTVAHSSSNQGNLDIGLGGEWKISPYNRGKLFLEARYVKMFTPNRPLPPGYNAMLIPVTFGYRW